MSRPKRCGEEGYATIAAAGIIVAIVSLLLIVAAVARAWPRDTRLRWRPTSRRLPVPGPSLRVKMLAPPRAIPPRLTTPP